MKSKVKKVHTSKKLKSKAEAFENKEPHHGINLNLSSWQRQFKFAKKSGHQPEPALFGNLLNRFDIAEW